MVGYATKNRFFFNLSLSLILFDNKLINTDILFTVVFFGRVNVIKWVINKLKCLYLAGILGLV